MVYMSGGIGVTARMASVVQLLVMIMATNVLSAMKNLVASPLKLRER